MNSPFSKLFGRPSLLSLLIRFVRANRRHGGGRECVEKIIPIRAFVCSRLDTPKCIKRRGRRLPAPLDGKGCVTAKCAGAESTTSHRKVPSRRTGNGNEVSPNTRTTGYAADTDVTKTTSSPCCPPERRNFRRSVSSARAGVRPKSV